MEILRHTLFAGESKPLLQGNQLLRTVYLRVGILVSRLLIGKSAVSKWRIGVRSMHTCKFP